MNDLIQIKLHGVLGKKFGECWELAVSSVSAAINAINELTDGKFYQYLGLKEQKGAKYNILINGEDFVSSEGHLDSEQDVKKIVNTNLVIPLSNLKTIDIIPVIQGADSGLLTTILGGLLVVIGVVLLIIPGFNMLGFAAIMIGAGLLAAGITALLSKPPVFEDFRDIGGGKKASYLFNGPENTTREGGPVPVGYGRLLVGSQVIAASYVIKDAGGTTITLGATRGFYIQAPLNYFSGPGDPGYDRFGSLLFRRGYYEINENATELGDFIVTFRPPPETVINLMNQNIPVANWESAYKPIGPNPSKNPYPDSFYNGLPYPFGAF